LQVENNGIVFQTHFVYIADQLQLFMNKLKKETIAGLTKTLYILYHPRLAPFEVEGLPRAPLEATRSALKPVGGSFGCELKTNRFRRG
jgi:hypothetical protein